MRKLIAVGVLVGGLLAQTGSAQAQPLPNQAGIGDPLTLAAFGVLLPYITGGPGGTLALIEIASPVGYNKSPNIHLIFFNNTCTRTGDSLDLPETVNDIAFVDVASGVAPGTDGLVAVGATPLLNPIHSRVYEFNSADGRSRVLEPIILDTAEFGVATGHNEHIWSPLRTAATFYAPQETATVKTQLTLICPRAGIQGDFDAAFGSGPGPFSTSGFPVIFPALFPSGGGSGGSAGPQLLGVVYDTDELFIANVHFPCDCITPDFSVTGISSVGAYTGAAAAKGTYTELAVAPTASGAGSFTGYKASFTVGSPLNSFFGRLSNGNSKNIFTPAGVAAPGPGLPPFPSIPANSAR